eukprot:m.114682 g.114682  ORF g.114682 m.114682 type:complete len:562 (+) comp19364_c0_seq3:1-1686(+)
MDRGAEAAAASAGAPATAGGGSGVSDDASAAESPARVRPSPPFGFRRLELIGTCPLCGMDDQVLRQLVTPESVIDCCMDEDCMSRLNERKFRSDRPDPAAEFERGNGVLAKTALGRLRSAVVEARVAPDTYRVRWTSGSLLDTLKTPAEMILCYEYTCENTANDDPEYFGPCRGILSSTGDAVGNQDSALDSVVLQDNPLSAAEQVALEAALDPLSLRRPHDYHPGSHKKVLNLFHPATYPYVKGISVLKDMTREAWIPVDPEEETDPLQKPSRYQWLPCEMAVAADGAALIESYISGLGQRHEFPEVYVEMEKLFSKCVPLLNTALRKHLKAADFDLRGRTVQVVCKSVYYVLRAHQSYEGVWHVEGSPNENIAASAIYYMDSSPFLKDLGLGFRRRITEEEEHELTMEYHRETNPPDFAWYNSAIDLGSVDTPARRMIAFPNDHQHRVLGLVNETDKTALRKIVCFFVVDPSARVLSTADVPDQRFEQYKVADLIQLWSYRRSGMFLPMQIVRDIVSMAKVGLTKAEAHYHRKQLMMDRKFYKNELNKLVEREINLCEH